MSEQTAIIFQANRKKFIDRSLKIGAIGLLGFITLIIVVGQGYGDDVAVFPAGVFFCSILCWIAQVGLVYRCPQCRTIPMRAVGRQSGVDFNPTHCRKCAAVLQLSE